MSTLSTLEKIIASKLIPFRNHSALDELGINPNISFDFIQQNPDIEWRWNTLIFSNKIPRDFIYSDEKLLKNESVLFNPNLTIDDIKKGVADGIFTKSHFAFRHFDVKIMEENPELPWDWHWASSNPTITYEFIKKHLDKPWNWESLSSLPNFTWNMMEFIPKEKINDLLWFNITVNKNITPEIIKNNPDYPWRLRMTTEHSDFSLDKFNTLPDDEKDWDDLSSYLELTWEFVKLHLDKPWDWESLSDHKWVTLDIVKANPDIPWNLESISAHRNITMEVIDQNPEYPWNWSGVFLNPNLTLEMVEKIVKNNLCSDLDYASYNLATNTFLRGF